MFAAGIYSDGYLVTVGTGSSFYGKFGKNEYFGGGYGSLISDEGSGYWIAREGFEAAIKDFEHRGEKTLLRELIAQKLGGTAETFRTAVMSMYDMENLNYISFIASCAILVTKAAYKGDKIAVDILSRAGRSLAEQLLFLVEDNALPKNLPVAVSGNVWRGHSVILSEFSDTLKKSGMVGKIQLPVFEPVVGAILCHYHNNIKNITSADEEKFLNLYKDYKIIL